MKKVGIIYREYEHYTLNKELCHLLEENNILIIGILPNSHYREVLDLCDGVILQGGSDYTSKDLEIVKYLWEQDIPTLGICLGMQMMSVLFGDNLEKLLNDSHYSNELYKHDILIDRHSKLYQILKKDMIQVNSRHYDYVRTTSLRVSAISKDLVIEAVEDPRKKYFIGVQWHPESIRDENSYQLFHSFFSALNIDKC